MVLDCNKKQNCYYLIEFEESKTDWEIIKLLLFSHKKEKVKTKKEKTLNNLSIVWNFRFLDFLLFYEHKSLEIFHQM